MINEALVLREINRIREHELQLPPIDEIPLGSPGAAASCPIARALVRGKESWCAYACSEEVVVTSAVGVVRTVKFPVAVGEFVRAFDAGRLPEYEEPDGV